MNFKSTIALALVAAGCAGVYFYGPTIGEKIGVAPPVEPPPDTTLADRLAKITPDKIVGITLTAPGRPKLELLADLPGTPLKLPGNWPVRRVEADELRNLLGRMQTRFAPEKLPADVRLFGFDQAVDVTVTLADGVTEQLQFAQAPPTTGQNPFVRPTYVRLDGSANVLRLGPDVMEKLNRSGEAYLRRQLFPDAPRLPLVDAAARASDSEAPAAVVVPTFADAVASIIVSTPEGNYTVKRVSPSPTPLAPIEPAGARAVVTPTRLAEAWRLEAPLVDRIDPTRLRDLLTGIPETLVEKFYLDPNLVAQGVGGLYPAWFENRTAFTEGYRLTVVFTDGSTRSLVLGGISRGITRTEPAPPPMFPGQPQQPPKITRENWRFAKLVGNAAVFEIKEEKLKNVLFFDAAPEPLDGKPSLADRLRDKTVTRFDVDGIAKAVVSVPDRSALVLEKTFSNKKALVEDAREERWDLRGPIEGLAESSQATSLLDPLKNLTGTIVDRGVMHAAIGGLASADLVAFGLTESAATKVTLTSDPRVGLPERTLLFGTAGKKQFVRMADVPDRLTLVEDTARNAFVRDARIYRSRKVFDLGEDRVSEVVVTRGTAETYALAEVPGAETGWMILAPVRAEADVRKAGDLARDFGALQTTEFVYDPPTAEESKRRAVAVGGLIASVESIADATFGLDTPTTIVKVRFAGPKRVPVEVLEFGKERAGKDEVYARKQGSSAVFTVPKAVPTLLAQGSVAFLPTELWKASVVKIEIRRGAETPYTVEPAGATWKLTAPFTGAIDGSKMIALAADFATLKAERYEAHRAIDPAAYGLDQPVLAVTLTLDEERPAKAGQEPTKERRTRTLLFGRAEGMTRFARLEGDATPAVFTVSDKLFASADQSVLDLLDKTLLRVQPFAVSKLAVGGVTLVREGATWKPEGSTFPVDGPTVSGILQTLATLPAEKYAAYGPKVDFKAFGLDGTPPTLVVFADGVESKLSFGGTVPNTPGDRYVRLNDNPGVAIVAGEAVSKLALTKLDFVDRSLVKGKPEEWQSLKRTVGKETLEISQNAAGAWEIVKPLTAKADLPGMEELLDRVSNLRAERVAAVDGKDLKMYGLDTPSAVWTFERLDGRSGRAETIELRVGGLVGKGSDERYVQTRGSVIGVLDGATAKKLLAPPASFRDRSIASFVSADQLTITRDSRKATFIKGASGWQLREPINGDAEDENLRELHDKLARLRAEEFVGDVPKDLKPYGLDKPTRLVFANGGKEVLNLLVGGRDKGGFRAYAMLEKGKTVFLLDMDLTTRVNAEYRKRALWEPVDVAQAASITIASGDTKLKLDKGPLGWREVGDVTAKIETSAVNEFLATLANLKAERFIEDVDADVTLFGLDEPKTITLTTTGGRTVRLLLGSMTETKGIYAKLDDAKRTDVFVLSPSDAAKLSREKAGFRVGGKR